MDIKAGDELKHEASGFEGVLIAPANGSAWNYFQFPSRANIPVVALMSGDGEVRFFDADELSLS